jgi:hypothetical protein
MQILNRYWHEVDYQTPSSHNQMASDRYMAGLSNTQTSSRKSITWVETEMEGNIIIASKLRACELQNWVETLVQNLWSMYDVILGYSNAGMERHTELKGF